MKNVRIGVGAGFSGDRIEPAADLARHGALDYLVFECLAERTIALAQGEKAKDPAKGYDNLLARRMQAVLPDCVKNGTRIITNMGAANPAAAAGVVREVARTLGISGLKIAAVLGDDVLDLVLKQSDKNILACQENDIPTQTIISANAYLGAKPIVEALAAGADVIITGRAADPAMFLAPLVHELGWSFEDWSSLGKGTLYGHLMECSAQISGGYFADGLHKIVPNLSKVGFPFIDVCEDGTAVISKLPHSGGLISKATCTEQLLYEIHDPQEYFQPDVIADFSDVGFQELGENKVQVSGGSGKPKTGKIKVSVGYSDCWIGEGQISYAGPLALERSKLALEILEDRLVEIGLSVQEKRADLIGIDSICEGSFDGQAIPNEIRVRFAARCQNQEDAARIGEEVDALYLNGPSGGGGVTKQVRKVVSIASCYLDEDAIETSIEFLEV
ncbi:acyclic terpene utilization AtuA family protein [Terasakiella pusilla]|uniref:acyclic terpene utilization AtuA family protein n=1 Tax=Terasakiella pusilla TaxID=64973 RepID=UPI003AA7EDBA